MCRLLGVVAREPAALGDLLAEEIPEFLALSREHADGWGIASWAGDEAAVVRDVAAAHDSARFAAATRTELDSGLLHIRLASSGSPVAPQNTHPFVGPGIAFAHNGFFAPRDALDAVIPAELLATAAGNTDSERYFLLLRALLREHDPATAISLAAARIRARATEFASLNCLLLTEEALYAYSEEDPRSEVSKRRGPDFFRLRYHATADRVVVGSSGLPTAEAEWSLLPYRQVLEIHRSDLRVTIHPADPAATAA
ncbi:MULTISPECIES: class II glutamine amidotransferase [unclassified Saccharopolyspora]|uniref:class II glutamine amidotransferase n=1 Tax=unclassified Saccharopolyspora TaxID=2646250 RepID=UPI001CD3BCF5|nr:MULTISPECIES: class II glutamine amidotransferase [unclassified Saccharopolyspora]MCA1192995.1 class II glutamine amidotransferase [Saccharopolyspora sp. 6V]MCA1226587.1 class II glutamine amidotransferase [Saccharopolyspora sp. 6M]